MVSIPTPSTSTGNIPPRKPEEMFDELYFKVPSDVKADNPRQFTPYRILYQNWYKTIPYALRVVPSEEQPSSFISPVQAAPLCYFFPVNPESLTVNTPFATQVTPTIGGIVQEHSGAVFYNITLSGTTAVLPDIDYSNGVSRDPESQRPTVAGKSLIPPFPGSSLVPGINAINAIASAITGTSAKLVDGTRNQTSGYTAFHVLYKFLWLYHFTKANGVKHQLRFVNYKDGNQYDVVVQNFQLTRDKSRPHLYQYTIQMKGWQLSAVKDTFNFTDKDRLKKLGLDEPPSLKAEIFRVINQTKAVLNGAAGLLNAAAQDLAF